MTAFYGAGSTISGYSLRDHEYPPPPKPPPPTLIHAGIFFGMRSQWPMSMAYGMLCHEYPSTLLDLDQGRCRSDAESIMVNDSMRYGEYITPPLLRACVQGV